MREQHFFLTRDAAARGGRREKVHAAKRDVWTGRAVTACGGLAVADGPAMDPAEVPENRRCRAGGCKQRWAGWLSNHVGPQDGS